MAGPLVVSISSAWLVTLCDSISSTTVELWDISGKTCQKLYFTPWGLMKECISFSESKHINEKRWTWSYYFPRVPQLYGRVFQPQRQIHLDPETLYCGRSCYIPCNVQKHPSHYLLDVHSILHPLLQPKSVQILPSFFQVKPRWDAPLHSSLFDCLSLISLYEKWL